MARSGVLTYSRRFSNSACELLLVNLELSCLKFHKVKKFNAFGMHGPQINRVNESLYPAPTTEPKPNLPPLIHLIESTWNGGQIDHEPIRVELRSSVSGNELELIVEAPFFNKQPAPPQGGRPVFDLWKYEVVEAYFLNDKNHYICVQMSPYGQYRVYLYNGSRKYIRSNLPLEYEAQISGTSWESMARIPVEYLPTNVTKFNAFAMHGLKPNRVHESLYPAPITELKPNFHALEYFKPIDLNEIMPGLATAGMSEVWKVSLERPPLIHLIESTWNGGQIDHEPIRVELRSSVSGNELELIVEAPFFNKQPAPPQGGRPVFDLWKYEAVEAYFLNDKNHYICVQMSPYGQYMVYLYNGSRKYIRSNLPLKYEAQIIGTSWESMARIPVEYLPTNVTKFNAFAMHGLKPNRVHESLYPAPITELKPNFHVLEYFNPIDLTELMPGLATAGMSEVWKVSLESSELEYRFNITSTWNGGEIDHDPIQFKFSASPKGSFMELSIIAPFFNDQSAPPGISLWKCEVVEAYFLNDDNQYLQVQLSPYGKHVVYLLNGARTYIRYRLPMEYKAQINGNTWTGNAKIPVEYLPQNVTKFNLFGQHGTKPNRFYESMFPAPSTELKPDFHALEYFKAIDLTRILPGLVNAEMSEIWRDSIEGIFRYRIQTTWNDKYIYQSPAEITLQGFTGGVEMNVTAPFFNDPKPGGETGKPFYGLWDYEVVEMFFLNDAEEYLEVELGPWGEHLLLVLKGAHNALKHSLPLDYIVIERTDPSGANPGVWRGSALIPPEYFPPNVNRMNAYAIHGTEDAREYQSLYPAPYGDPDYAQADFHRLELFHPIDFEYLVANNSDYSDFWREAIGSGSASLTTEVEEVTTILPLKDPEEDIEFTTLLGPAEGTFFGPTTAPPRPTFTQSGPTPTPIQTSFSHPVQGQVNQTIRHTSPTRSPFRQSNQEPFSRIPRPQLVVGNEPREERQKEGVRKMIPGFNQSSRIPQPQRVNLPNDPSIKERRPVQIRRPSVSNQNHFSINDPFPTHGEDQPLASSQIHGQGQTFVTTPLQGGRQPVFPIEEESFSNHNIRQPDRPSLFDEVAIQSEGQTPFPNQGQFHRQDQPQFVDQGKQPVRNQGRPHLPSRGQVRFQDQGQSHLGNQPFQNQGQTLFADDVQPNTHRQGQLPFPNSEQSFQSHGQEQFANPQLQNQNQPIRQQFPVENPNSPAFTVQSPPRFQEQNRPAIQTQEAVQFERPSGTSQSVGFQPENQVFEEEQQSVDLPGSETSGGQSIASPEVEQAVITLAEGSPALPPPHPVCFELGLVPDPQRCFVFHECVLEGGEWQMYSWRCQRGQVFDPVNVACVRGRCPGSRRRRVRRP